MRASPRSLPHTRRHLDRTYRRVPDPTRSRYVAWELHRVGGLQVTLRWIAEYGPMRPALWLTALWNGSVDRHRGRPDLRLLPILARVADQLDAVLRFAASRGEPLVFMISVNGGDGLGPRRLALYQRKFFLFQVDFWPDRPDFYLATPLRSLDLAPRRAQLWTRHVRTPGIRRMHAALQHAATHTTRSRP